MTRFPIDGTGRLSSEVEHPTAALTGPAGGDLSGSFPNPTVATVNGHLANSAAVNIKDSPYGAKVDGKIVQDASITNGSKQLHSASAAFVVGDASKYVLLHDPSNSVPDLITTISSVAGGIATLAATWTGTTLTGTGFVLYGTDDTVAFQAAVTAFANAGGGDIYVPGIMVIAGALGNVVSEAIERGGPWLAQVSVPATSAKTPLRIVGEQPMNWLNEGIGVAVRGSIIACLSAGATYAANTALPCMFVARGNNTALVLENIGFIAPTNPGICLVNMGPACHGRAIGVGMCTTDFSTVYATQPTKPVGIGLIMPGESNFGNNLVQGFAADGFYTNLIAGELASGTDISIDCGLIGLSFLPTNQHGIGFGYVLANHTKYPIAYNDFTGAGLANVPNAVVLSIEHLEWEVGTAPWQTGGVIVNDPTNQIYGRIDHWIDSGSLAVNGAANVRFRSLAHVGVVGRSTRVILSADQAVTTVWPPAALTWGSPVDGPPHDWDVLGAWSNVHPTRLTVPANALQSDPDGLFLVEASVEFAAGAGIRVIALDKNNFGTPFLDGQELTGVANTNPVTLKLSTVMVLAQGDYLEVKAYSDAAVNATKAGAIRSHFSMTRLTADYIAG